MKMTFNDKNYCPENCKFATIQEQNRNRTSNINLTYNGITLCVTDWAKQVGGQAATIGNRFKKGWSTEECLYGKKKT